MNPFFFLPFRFGNWWFRNRKKSPMPLLDTLTLPFRVYPNDIDINIHMNNSRYLLFMDIARYALFIRCGGLKIIKKQRLSPILGGQIVRYRRPLNPFEKFTIEVKIVGWDDKWFFTLIRFLNSKGEVATTSLNRTLFLNSKNEKVPPIDIAKTLAPNVVAPKTPAFIEEWLEADEIMARTPLRNAP